jgi:hypothetical protein
MQAEQQGPFATLLVMRCAGSGVRDTLIADFDITGSVLLREDAGAALLIAPLLT